MPVLVTKYIDHVSLLAAGCPVGRNAGVEIIQSTLSSSVLGPGELLALWLHGPCAVEVFRSLEAGSQGRAERGSGACHRGALRGGAPGEGGKPVRAGAGGAASEGRITKTAVEVLPKNALGKACTCALKQWKRLERCAGAGQGIGGDRQQMG
jgi:hypothetical protein